MNEFTKEELETLRESNNIASTYHGWKPQREALLKKLNFMIDNYCEHKDKVSSSDDNGHMVVQCGRCDSVLWHEKD